MRLVRIALGLIIAALLSFADGPGFRTKKQFDEHYLKHGREFGNITQAEYLRRAQLLRDAPTGGTILQITKPDGVITKYDRRSAAFGAYNPDGTIRTFFMPNDGERYFRRQARRP